MKIITVEDCFDCPHCSVQILTLPSGKYYTCEKLVTSNPLTFPPECRIPHDEEQGFFLEQCPLQEVDKHEWYEGTGEHE